ncbi:MAG: AbrB/MazE/SpoVT family DNA-binding domain-containing protein [Pseudomonadales bacterium]|nr:AbrB/MazE/SpoVT family DNA-binding domain-containing protein [Pseudomonadales bacterium]
MLAKVQKWGNSQGLRLPKHLLESSDIVVGD